MTRDAEHAPTGYEDAASVVVNQAPAPSSLAGGISREQVLAIVRQFASPSWCSVDRLVDTLLAALSPEAPAREGDLGVAAELLRQWLNDYNPIPDDDLHEQTAEFLATLTPRHEAEPIHTGETPSGEAALYRDLENGIRPLTAPHHEAPADTVTISRAEYEKLKSGYPGDPSLLHEAPAEGAGEEWRYHPEPLQTADTALKALDDVDELVRFCSVSMLDTERYYRGAEAMWRVVHWIAGVTPDKKSLNREVPWVCKNCKTDFLSTMKDRVANGFDDHGTGPACPTCKAFGQFTYRVGFHLGDPCIHCGWPHDEVAVGPCSMSSERARSSAPEAREGVAVRRQRCTRCDRGEVFGMSDDSGFWVEFSSVAGGGNEHGMNGWLELVEHWPDGRDVRREYVAKDSPLYAAPSADKLRIAVEILMNTKRMLADKAIMPVQRVSWASKDVEKALAALKAEGA